MPKVPFENSSGNVSSDIGFTPAEAAELTAKSNLESVSFALNRI